MVAAAEIGIDCGSGDVGQQISRRARTTDSAEKARMGIADTVGMV